MSRYIPDQSQTFMQSGMGVGVCLREHPWYKQRPWAILAFATIKETKDLVSLRALSNPGWFFC